MCLPSLLRVFGRFLSVSLSLSVCLSVCFCLSLSLSLSLSLFLACTHTCMHASAMLSPKCVPCLVASYSSAAPPVSPCCYLTLSHTQTNWAKTSTPFQDSYELEGWDGAGLMTDVYDDSTDRVISVGVNEDLTIAFVAQASACLWRHALPRACMCCHVLQCVTMRRELRGATFLSVVLCFSPWHFLTAVPSVPLVSLKLTHPSLVSSGPQPG